MRLKPIPRPILAGLAGTLAVAALMLSVLAPALAEEGQEDGSPPGILIEPPKQAPGGPQDDEEGDEAPGPPGGPGCPVNRRPLELLV